MVERKSDNNHSWEGVKQILEQAEVEVSKIGAGVRSALMRIYGARIKGEGLNEIMFDVESDVPGFWNSEDNIDLVRAISQATEPKEVEGKMQIFRPKNGKRV